MERHLALQRTLCFGVFDPALLLVSIAKTSSNYHNFANTTHFAINILAEEQKDVSNTFARPSEDRFANLSWSKALARTR